MILINLKELVKNKVHLGHSFFSWDPRNIKYIYIFYKNIFIINLIYTRKNLIKAYNFLYKLSKKGHEIIFIGSKPQGKYFLKEAALISSMFYINTPWIPGMFTNNNLIKNRICLIIWFNIILKNIKKNKQNSINFITKLNNIYIKTKKNFKGLFGLSLLPKTIFILDPIYEDIAMKESIILKRNIISIVDTNINPDLISIPIPGNDDNILSIKLILQILTTALIQGFLIKLTI